MKPKLLEIVVFVGAGDARVPAAPGIEYDDASRARAALVRVLALRVQSATERVDVRRATEPLTRGGADRRYKFCRCAECGHVGQCTPGTARGDASDGPLLCASCFYAFSPPPPPPPPPHAVLVVVEQAGCLVMPEYPKDLGYFVLPGGKVESGEDPRQAAAREAREETGLLVDVEGEPFHVGETHDGKPMWAYRARWNPQVNARLPDEWRGPEGRVRLIPVESCAAAYKPDFLAAFRRVMDDFTPAPGGFAGRA